MLGTFGVKILNLTAGTFRPVPQKIRAVGTEHVHAHVIVQGTVAGQTVALNSAMTYRLVGGKVVEVWDLVETVDQPGHAATGAPAFSRVLLKVFVRAVRETTRAALAARRRR